MFDMGELISSWIDLVRVIPGLDKEQRKFYEEQYKRILAEYKNGQ